MTGIDISKVVRQNINDEGKRFLSDEDMADYINQSVTAIVKDRADSLMAATHAVRTITKLAVSATGLSTTISLDDRWSAAIVAYVEYLAHRRRGNINLYDPKRANEAALRYAQEIAR